MHTYCRVSAQSGDNQPSQPCIPAEQAQGARGPNLHLLQHQLPCQDLLQHEHFHQPPPDWLTDLHANIKWSVKIQSNGNISTISPDWLTNVHFTKYLVKIQSEKTQWSFSTLQIDAKISLWVTSWNRARVIRFNPMQTFLQTMPTQLPTKNGVPQLTRYQSPGTKSVKHLSLKDMVLGFMLLLPVRWISDLFYPGSLYEWWVLDQILVTGEIRTLSRDL